MNNRPTRALVAVMAGAGALLGAGAAVVWHVAVADETDTYAARPDWFPVSLYFLVAGVLAALFVASFLVDAGLRIRVTRRRSPAGLCILLLVLGGVLGACAAAAWTRWPPEPADVFGLVEGSYGWQAPSGATTGIQVVTGVDSALWGLGVGPAESFVAGVYAGQEQSDFRPVIEHPWTVFPIGGVLIAGALALSLSLRDVRLTGRES